MQRELQVLYRQRFVQLSKIRNQSCCARRGCRNGGHLLMLLFKSAHSTCCCSIKRYIKARTRRAPIRNNGRETCQWGKSVLYMKKTELLLGMLLCCCCSLAWFGFFSFPLLYWRAVFFAIIYLFCVIIKCWANFLSSYFGRF